MAQQKIRIRLKAFDHKILDQSSEKIVETAKRLVLVCLGQFRCRLRGRYILFYDLLTLKKIIASSLKCALIAA